MGPNTQGACTQIVRNNSYVTQGLADGPCPLHE